MALRPRHHRSDATSVDAASVTVDRLLTADRASRSQALDTSNDTAGADDATADTELAASTDAAATPAAARKSTSSTAKRTTATTAKPTPKTTAKPKPTTPPTSPKPPTTRPAPAPTVPPHSQTGEASWYDYRPGQCAHLTIPFGTVVTITNLANGAQAQCTVTDRGPTGAGRIIDLDRGTFAMLADPGAGVIDVRITW